MLTKKIGILSIACLVLFSITGSGCRNLFSELAKPTTDEAIYKAALILIDKKDYSGAITEFNKLSATFLANRDVAANHASAYAGRCGLNLLLLIDAIQESTSTNLFVTLMRQFTGAGAQHNEDCLQAETIVRSIGATADDRTVDENLLMAFISFAKIGAILARYADADEDDTPDVGFDSCNSGNLPTAQAREIAASINLIVDSLSADDVPSLIGDTTTDLADICTQFAALAPPFNNYAFCGATPAETDAADFTADQLKGIGVVIKMQDYPGLGTCAGDLATCAATASCL